MKAIWFALLCFGTAAFCGTVAFCQSPAPRKIDPDKLFQLPQKFIQPAPSFESLKPLPPMRNDLVLPRPGMTSPHPKNDQQIDPKIILRPPWKNHSKGQDLSHLFPNLKLLPLR